MSLGDNLPVANSVTLPVTLPVAGSMLGRLLMVLNHEMGMAELLKSLNMKNHPLRYCEGGGAGGRSARRL